MADEELSWDETGEAISAVLTTRAGRWIGGCIFVPVFTFISFVGTLWLMIVHNPGNEASVRLWMLVFYLFVCGLAVYLTGLWTYNRTTEIIYRLRGIEKLLQGAKKDGELKGEQREDSDRRQQEPRSK